MHLIIAFKVVLQIRAIRIGLAAVSCNKNIIASSEELVLLAILLRETRLVLLDVIFFYFNFL